MDKETQIQEIMELEFKAISKTIVDYTNDNFIRSYAETLITLEYPKDKKILKLIVCKLNNWYKDEFDKISSNEYIYNLNSHNKSVSYLKELETLL